jgi:hypothetical protein
MSTQFYTDRQAEDYRNALLSARNAEESPRKKSKISGHRYFGYVLGTDPCNEIYKYKHNLEFHECLKRIRCIIHTSQDFLSRRMQSFDKNETRLVIFTTMHKRMDSSFYDVALLNDMRMSLKCYQYDGLLISSVLVENCCGFRTDWMFASTLSYYLEEVLPNVQLMTSRIYRYDEYD